MLEHLKTRIKQIKDAAIPIPEEDRNLRLDICKSCEYFFSPTSQCKKCGCMMKAKTYLPLSECPVGKWGKVIREPEDKN